MSSFPILDLVLGIIFIYFLLSIICSSIVEMVLTFKKTRASVLEKWFTQILNNPVNPGGPTLGATLLNHCSLTALSKPGAAPSYISSKNFSSALLQKLIEYGNVAAKDGGEVLTALSPTNLAGYISVIEKSTILPEELKQTFLMYANEAADTFTAMTTKTTGAIEMFQDKIETWYDSNMDRLSGTLKTEYTRKFTLVAAIVVTILMNADSITISQYLYNNPAAREALAAQATKAATDSTVKAEVDKIAQNLKGQDTTKIGVPELRAELSTEYNQINNAKAALGNSIPLGWTTATNPTTPIGWLTKIIGLLFTIIAVMMGAPFWFDMISKISNVRSSGAKPTSDTTK